MSIATKLIYAFYEGKTAETDMYCADCGAEFASGEKITCKNQSESKIFECSLKKGKKPKDFKSKE